MNVEVTICRRKLAIKIIISEIECNAKSKQNLILVLFDFKKEFKLSIHGRKS